MSETELNVLVGYECQVHGLISEDEATGLEEPAERYCPDSLAVLELQPDGSWYCPEHQLDTAPGTVH